MLGFGKGDFGRHLTLASGIVMGAASLLPFIVWLPGWPLSRLAGDSPKGRLGARGAKLAASIVPCGTEASKVFRRYTLAADGGGGAPVLLWTAAAELDG